MITRKKRRLVETTRNRFFAAIAKAVTSIKDVNELINAMVDIICTLLKIEKCSIQMLDEETKSWRMLGVDEQRKGVIKAEAVSLDKSISGLVKEKGQSFLVKNIAKDKRLTGYKEDIKKYKTRSFLLVPLKRGEKVIGIISATDKKSKEPFNEEDLELLSGLADQVVFAIESIRLSERMAYTKLVEKELKIAQVVQRDLLPKILPKVGGVSFSKKVSSAEMVAGDFYDLIFLDKNHLAFVVGDVEGKGIAAALLMVRVLTLIRSEVFQNSSPSHVLTKLNTLIGWGASSGLYVTLFYGVIDVYSRRLLYSSAGHEYPILYRGASGKISEFKAGDPFLGSFIGVDYEQAEVQLKTGDRLTIFTDGAVEVQNKKGEMLGREAYKDIIRKNAGLSGEELTQKLHDAVLEWRGGRPQADDMIILTLSIDDPVKPERTERIVIEARLELIKEVRSLAIKMAKELGFKEASLFDIEYATAEAVENCIKHARAEDDKVRISFLFGPDPNLPGQRNFVIIVQDEGQGFDVEKAANHHTEDFNKSTDDYGWGLVFIRNLMDEVSIRSKEGQGTEIRLMKILK